jgi:starch synthase (maltosyl-transferring)
MRGEVQSGIKIDGRCRAVISGVNPEIEGGRFAIKRTVGESVLVEADVFGDGHDQLSAVLLYRCAPGGPSCPAPFQSGR